MNSRTLYKIGRKMKEGLGPANPGGPLNEYILNKALHAFAEATMDVAKDQEAATMKKARIEEYFVPIEGFPNYEVSSYGRVVNINTHRDLKVEPNKDGYVYVNLSCNGVKSKLLLHRVVAKAFFVNYREGYEVVNINHNQSDNSVANLHLSPKRNRTRES